MKHKTIQISGKVVRGEGYGRKLGFPTANLDRRGYARLKEKIRPGIYAGIVEWKLKTKSRRLNAAIVVGPADKRQLPKIEAHLSGFNGNLYGQHLNIYLNKYLRPFKKFKNEQALKSRIKKDIKFINSKVKVQNSKVQIKG